jgi:pimeloyl-ACP methyl ester carboxylesterase
MTMPVPTSAGSARDSRHVTTPDGTFHCLLAGTGRPVIVLVNGAGGPIAGWSRVLPRLAEFGMVVAYDRLGVGRSSAPRRPQTGEAIVEGLRDLLGTIGCDPPFVLVGHSLGGLYVNLFARRQPDEVAAVVLLEAAHPDDRSLADLQPRWLRGVNRLLSRAGPRRRDEAFAEVRWVDETVRQLDAAGPFAPVPLAVVTGGRRPPRWLLPAAAAELRAANQRALAGLSLRSRHVVAARSGHFPQLSEPDVVIDAVRWVIDELAADGRRSAREDAQAHEG